ncbi:MAG: methyltransferase domain-containing protein [Candidatus Methylarchaceae archaeon HK02M1]|nr:methyltransferase domain-containing protein [Candidatus Methylarchaceae archaeon HK02M1]
MKDDVLRVTRTKEEAKEIYNKLSKFYDYFTIFERRYSERTLDLLSIKRGEIVLEIGFGTGRYLKRMAELVGMTSKAYGIDISLGMLEVTKKRLKKAGLMDRVELYCEDALQIPYEDDMFDAIFMSFTLELFDTPEIPIVLEEARRVLKPNGRLGIVSISNEDGESIPLRVYKWAHQNFPKHIDCRPIYVEKSIKSAGYEVRCKERVKMFGFPIEIVIGINSKRKL